MAVSQYPWAEFRNTKAGIKIHTRIVFDTENNWITPDKIVITPAKGADKTKMIVSNGYLFTSLFV